MPLLNWSGTSVHRRSSKLSWIGWNDIDRRKAGTPTSLCKTLPSEKLQGYRQTTTGGSCQNHLSSPPNITANGACTRKKTLTSTDWKERRHKILGRWSRDGRVEGPACDAGLMDGVVKNYQKLKKIYEKISESRIAIDIRTEYGAEGELFGVCEMVMLVQRKGTPLRETNQSQDAHGRASWCVWTMVRLLVNTKIGLYFQKSRLYFQKLSKNLENGKKCGHICTRLS